MKKNPSMNRDEIIIQNVVTTADLKQRVDITLFNRFNWGLYDLEYYGGRVGYIKDAYMQGKVTIFPSGKMISIGTKSINQSIKQLEYSMNLMHRNNLVENVVLNPIVRNIVATWNVGQKIDLNSLAADLPKSVYEPEQFPGLIIKVSQSCTFLIFSSGKVVITGAKSEEEIKSSIKKIAVLIKNFLYN